MEKICTDCKQSKNINEFEKNERYKGGYMHQCNNCRYVKRMERIRNNREKYNAHTRKRYRRRLEQNPEYERDRVAKYKNTMAGKMKCWKADAIKRGILWDLSLEDLEAMPQICHYTKHELTMDRGHFNSISLDRLDSAQGYVKNNVVFCCKVVNLMKIDLAVRDFIYWCKAVSQANA
jgi:hypothetical protein